MATLVILLVVVCQVTCHQVDRVDYSNDTAAASPKGPLTTSNIVMRQQEVITLVILLFV